MTLLLSSHVNGETLIPVHTLTWMMLPRDRVQTHKQVPVMVKYICAYLFIFLWKDNSTKLKTITNPNQ